MDDVLAGDVMSLVRELGRPYGEDDADGLIEFLEEMRYAFLLSGPPGWLPPIRHDGLLGIGLRDGQITTTALDRRDVRGPHVALAGVRMAAIARRVIGPDPSWFGPEVMELRELLELVAAEAPEVFRRSRSGATLRSWTASQVTATRRRSTSVMSRSRRIRSLRLGLERSPRGQSTPAVRSVVKRDRTRSLRPRGENQLTQACTRDRGG